MAQPSKTLQPNPEKELKEEKTIFDFFGRKEPAHVGAGVGMGLRSIAKGVFAGAAGLVMQPMVGLEKGGVLGFSKGKVIERSGKLYVVETMMLEDLDFQSGSILGVTI